MHQVIVDCKTLKVGDVVRRPVPDSEWLEVVEVNPATRFLRVRAIEAGDTFEMQGDSKAKWMVKREGA